VTRYGVYGGYGYMWWVAVRGQHFPGVDVGPGAFSAQGYGGHYLVVLPAYGLVVVHRRDTDNIGPDSDEQRRNREFGALLAMILHSKGR
jgi:CubicO group peptidase (beta-lactamase class C family)